MSQSEKAHYFRTLKEAGVEFSKHYREYNTAELKAACDRLLEQQGPPPEQPQDPVPPNPPPPTPPVSSPEPSEGEAPPAGFFGFDEDFQQLEYAARRPSAPMAAADPNEMAGQRQNTKELDEPIRTDEMGRVWLQEEVRKPGFPKPRGRRVLKYLDTGVEQQTVKSGEFIETFEVAGSGAPRTAEARITLPSFQVGIFRDPRFPDFKVHIYNEQMGFDLFDIRDYYGGAELVPADIKRVYIANVLCYDIRTTVRAIETEFRRLQLAGKIKE